jgi:hypothetical protein
MTCPIRSRPKFLSKRLFHLAGVISVYIIVMTVHFLRPTQIARMSKTEMSHISPECYSTASPYEEQQQLQTTVESAPSLSASSSHSASSTFRILCTSTRKRILWGSYELRCQDLKVWVNRCVPEVYIQTGVSFEDFERWRLIRSILGQLSPEERIMYNASIFVKSYPKKSLPIYGKMFMDVVDEYGIPDHKVPSYVDLILQTKWQGQDWYPSHNYSVVEHWYNSFPADMARMGSPAVIPTIAVNDRQTPLKMATVWNTRRSHDPSEGGCPKVSVSGVSYHCLDKEFDISKWYVQVMKQKDSQCHMEHTLTNPDLGPGKLYYDIFQKYDALVVLAKNHTMKLDYGNVQRAISQMRSGVPVLVEIRGQVLQDFMDRYNYTCAFVRYEEMRNNNRRLWSFNEAVEKLKDVNIRRECQRQGLEIVKDYSPSKIAQKFLRTVGYKGAFSC